MRQWIRKRSKGQTTAEYAIIVALVAVSSIAIILIFGDQIRSLFSSEAKRIATDTQQTVQDQTGGADAAVKGHTNTF